tara:strand:- start:4268 stop:5212 length:945 start_codon:yes stop_codon:yes gene_type:complete
MELKDVFVVTKPLQYINVLNIASKRPKVLIIVNAFVNSKEFFDNIQNNNSNWSKLFYFENMSESFLWLIKNKDHFDSLFIDSDLNYRGEFFKLRHLNISVYEEGMGIYRKRQVKPRRKIFGKLYLFFLSIRGYKNKRGGSRYTKNIIVYFPNFYRRYHNENIKNIVSFQKPFLEHLKYIDNLTIFKHNINLDICKDKTVLLYVSDWKIEDEDLKFISNFNSEIKVLKPHPHIKLNIDKKFIDLVIPGEIPVEILITQIIKSSKILYIVSRYSSSTIYFLKIPNVRIINLDIRPDPYNDGESYMEAYKNLTQDIK